VRVEVQLVRVQREQREPRVVHLADGTTHRVAIDGTDLEVLVVAAGPTLLDGQTRLPSLPRSTAARSIQLHPKSSGLDVKIRVRPGRGRLVESIRPCRERDVLVLDAAGEQPIGRRHPGSNKADKQ
jgi:hypothetical protein